MNPYTITLEALTSRHSVTLPLGENVPQPKEGGGGWEEVPLPRRGAVAVWKGRGLMKLAVPVHIDHTESGVSVMPDLMTLRHMHRPFDETDEPPVLAVSSPGSAIPVIDEVLEWVLQDIEWGEAVGDDEGNRIQQKLILQLLEYRADKRLESVAEEHRKQHTRPWRYTIVRADIAGGLGGIAERLHVPGGGKALASVQSPPRKDPRLFDSDIGKHLLIPIGTGVPGVLIVGEHAQPITRG